MKTLLNSLLTPAALILTAVANFAVNDLTVIQGEILIVFTGALCIYTFSDVYASLTTKNQ